MPAPIGYAHPPEPTCSYDPVEGLTLAPETDPVQKIRELEDEISQLRNQLHEQQLQNQINQRATKHPGTASSEPSPGAIATSSTTQTSTARSHTSSPAGYNGTPGRTPMALTHILTPDSPETLAERLREASKSPEVASTSSLKTINSERYMELLFSGWNPDLPPPELLHHYIDVFFRCDPCGSRVLHHSSLMTSLLLSPRDPNFPHPALLHAICASASRWSPRNMTTLPDGTRRDQFAEFHAGKTRQYIDRTMASGDDIFPVMQACIILSWYFYQEGRWVEVWIFAGFQTRVAIPLRLNYPGTFTSHGASSPGAYLAPPKDFKDLESRRRTWWMTIMFDRIASVGGWVHAVDERDLGTEFPLRSREFEAETSIPPNPQSLANKDIFTTHLAHYTDPFILLLKAVMLFGKVTDFNVRTNLRTPPSKSQNPFYLEGFAELDQLVSNDFLESLPAPYYNNSGLTDLATGGSSLDSDLFMAQIIPHAATITLHNPFIEFTDPKCVSTARCVNAARSILASYYALSATSLDITRLHPFVTICWYLAAVVQVQLCKYFIEIGDSERESTVWGEINVLRFAMLEYGARSPIGARQEKLLQGLMREIVRLTAQKQPLQVGVPLYPFSKNSLWRKDEPASTGIVASPGSSGGEENAVVMPLPAGTYANETASSTPATSYQHFDQFDDSAFVGSVHLSDPKMVDDPNGMWSMPGGSGEIPHM